MIFSIRVILRKEKMGKQLEQQKALGPHYPRLKDNIVLSIDKNERITKFSEQCEKLFGYRKNEVINKTVSEFFIPKQYHDKWMHLYEYSKINKSVDNFEIPFLTKSGQEITVSWSNFPIKNEEGEITDIGFVGELITPVKQYYENHQKGDLHLFPKLSVRKKKRQELEDILIELDKRKKDLNDLESKLLDEKTKINEQMNDLKIWREKLELLNDKLEEKQNQIIKHETLLVQQPTYSIDFENVAETKSKKLYGRHETFDQIQDSAVILQRGILRHANSSFVDLIGYNVDEIVDKSFFDFIDPEGFLNIERFYLSRLKGVDVSSYQTVILNKDNDKIPIEVNTKPTFFNGEKAEIAVVKILKNIIKK